MQSFFQHLVHPPLIHSIRSGYLVLKFPIPVSNPAVNSIIKRQRIGGHRTSSFLRVEPPSRFEFLFIPCSERISYQRAQLFGKTRIPNSLACEAISLSANHLWKPIRIRSSPSACVAHAVRGLLATKQWPRARAQLILVDMAAYAMAFNNRGNSVL